MANPEKIKDISIRILLSAIILSPFLIYGGISYRIMQNSPIDKGPWATWFSDPRFEMSISWESSKNGVGSVKYGLAPDALLNESIGVQGMIHHVNLTGLIPNTRYYYSAFVDDVVFGNGTFKTAPADSNTSFSWVMISDTQQLGNIHSGFHGMIAKRIPIENHSFITIVGDLTNDGNDPVMFHDFFRKAAPYLPYLPLIPVIGNHDWYGYNNSNFFSYFPHNQGQTSRNLFYYSFRYSMIHFTIMHAGYGTEMEITSEQLAWVDNDLKNAQDAVYRIVLIHCPIDAAGFFGENPLLKTNLLPILYRNNVSAVISGHEHHYERGYFEDTKKEYSDGNKMMFMILGGGGSLQDFANRHIPETVYMSTGPSYTEVFASPEKLVFETRTPHGTLLDRAEIANPKIGGN